MKQYRHSYSLTVGEISRLNIWPLLKNAIKNNSDSCIIETYRKLFAAQECARSLISHGIREIEIYSEILGITPLPGIDDVGALGFEI